MIYERGVEKVSAALSLSDSDDLFPTDLCNSFLKDRFDLVVDGVVPHYDLDSPCSGGWTLSYCSVCLASFCTSCVTTFVCSICRFVNGSSILIFFG